MRTALAVLLLGGAVRAGELASAGREIVRAADRVRPSVVTVLTPRASDFDLTGVVVSSHGVVLTLRGPLLGESGALPDSVQVRFPGKGKTVAAHPIDEDAGTNTVLLEVPKMSTRAIQTRRSQDARLGMWVMLVGNTFGAGRESTPTVSLGIVSGIVGDRDRVTAIHASTLVNPGSFGAPVVDSGGGLIGITALRVTRSGGQSVVIPFDRIRERYRRKGKKGAAIFASAPRPRGVSRRITDLFGVVMEAAARKARAVVVGVRAAAIESDRAAPRPPAGGKRARGPRQPRPVPGALSAYDRSSGVVIAPQGWIVCPLRVTGWPGPRRPLLVDLADGRSLPAELLGADERTRLALIAIRAGNLRVLEDAPAAGLRTGQFVLALGFAHDAPRKGTLQVTFGVISRTNALGALHPAFQAVQTDAGVAGGNRGGALVDIDGRLVGVLLDPNDTEAQGYATRAQGRYTGNAGLGFAVPMHVLRRLAPRLARGERMRMGFLGVSTDEAEQGLRVIEVVGSNTKKERTTAARAGLQPGDVLVSIEKMVLRHPEDLRRTLALFTVGDRIEIVYRREGQERRVTVRLGER